VSRSGHVRYRVVNAGSLELARRTDDQRSGPSSPERSEGDLCPEGGKRFLFGDGEERRAVWAIHESDHVMLSTSFTLRSCVMRLGLMIDSKRVAGRMLVL
jgi:hypothetical protein